MPLPGGNGAGGVALQLPVNFMEIIDHRITSRFLRHISSMSRMYSWGYFGLVKRLTWVPEMVLVTPPEPRDKMEWSSSIIYIL